MYLSEAVKRCAYHDRDEPIGAFRLKPNGRYDSWCIEARREYGRQYSARAYAPRKAEVAAQRAVEEAPTTKVCIDCERTLEVTEFPERSDRPGKRHGRCLRCYRKITAIRNREYALLNSEKIAEAKRAYHATHPGYNANASRRRRAKLRDNRTEHYSKMELWERDGGYCCLCGKPVDLSLNWPDPSSATIEHHHPITKGGPDAPNNVGIAHWRCNRAKGTDYVPPFNTWTVTPIGSKLARDIVKAHHYLHRASNTSFAYGLFDEAESLKGVVIFGTPSSYRINRSACPSDPGLVIELNRLWIDPYTPFGAASWFVSRALKQLPPYIVVSYADTSVLDTRDQRSHDGTVYRALSFCYAGQTKPRKEWRMPGKAHNVGPDVPGSVLSDVTSKHRYWTVTGDRREKRALRTLCQWPELPYD